MVRQRPDNGSRVSRETHARFCERLRGKFPRPTHQRNGFVLWQKRLERDRFHWPRGDSLTVTLNGQELNWLLDGFDLRQWRPHARLNYSWVA